MNIFNNIGSDSINNKRLIVILFLTIFAVSLFGLTKTYESRLISKNNIEVMTNYGLFKNVLGFKKENRERYIRYYEKNQNLNHEDIVTHVNIGLDYGFYNYIRNCDISKDILILVNKYSKLDKNYVPNDLEEINSKYFIYGNQNKRMLKKEAKNAFERLSEASIKNRTPVYGQSAYRSYESQDILYKNEVKNDGSEKADSDVARPGHSEHQTGLTIDVSSNKTGNMLDFQNTDSFKWMQNNAYKYGFILRYPRGKESVHGYIYESWHYRYVGIKVARDMHDNYSNLTFDEYYYRFIEK